MSMKQVLTVVGAGLLQNTLAQSVSSCGSATDHVKNVKVTLTPDPPVPGQDITVQITGDNDEDVATGSFNLDLAVQALGVINNKVQLGAPFEFQPTPFKKGPIDIKVGPTALLKTPGSTSIKGTVKAVDASNQQLFCVNLDLKTVSDINTITLSNSSAPVVGDGVTSCTQASDHIKNFALDTTGGKVAVTGQLDEDVSTFHVAVDAVLKKLFIKIPAKLDIPVTCAPGFTKGDFKLSLGPMTGGLVPDPQVSLTGTVKMNDQANQEVFCLNVDQVLEKEIVV
jgi:hypothetical protein